MCVLFPGMFGVVVQGILLCMSIFILVFKKHREVNDRTWFEFLLDSSKQLLGSGWAHVLNILLAMVLVLDTEGDQCQMYWLNLMLDTTIGIFIEYTLLLTLTRCVECVTGDVGMRSGEYRSSMGELERGRYVKQLVLWLACVTGMKLFVLFILIVFAELLSWCSGYVFQELPHGPKFELIFVMLFTPAVMNALQFWVTDNILQKKHASRRPDKTLEMRCTL
mmetsp:Transcript_58877/g.156764  ORF Transcript_58877/g.156764 Transcript_58877/m.156764 type:complete len:221 (-) Transcript_58877:60-722(-)